MAPAPSIATPKGLLKATAAPMPSWKPGWGETFYYKDVGQKLSGARGAWRALLVISVEWWAGFSTEPVFYCRTSDGTEDEYVAVYLSQDEWARHAPE